MRGFITLFSRKGEVLIFGEYSNKEERRLVMSVWEDRYAPIGYYFIVEPIVEEDYNKNRKPYVPISRAVKSLIKKEAVVIPDAKTNMVRPIAAYDNIKSHYGISDELHKQIKQ